MPVSRPSRPGRRRRLPAPWIALALVPAFFLAGFGLVSALTGSDDAEPAAATSPSTQRSEPATGVQTVETVAGPPPTTTAAVPAAPATPDVTDGTTTASTGEAPPAYWPPPGTIEVRYGRWEGVFEISGAKLVRTYGASTVSGRFTYSGGADCEVRKVVVEGRFYDVDGVPVGVAYWESSWATGQGGLQRGRALPLEAYGMVFHRAESAELKIANVICR